MEASICHLCLCCDDFHAYMGKKWTCWREDLWYL